MIVKSCKLFCEDGVRTVYIGDREREEWCPCKLGKRAKQARRDNDESDAEERHTDLRRDQTCR